MSSADCGTWGRRSSGNCGRGNAGPARGRNTLHIEGAMKAGRVLVVGLLAAGVGAAAITALCCTDQTGSSPLMAVAAAPAQPVIFSATTLEVGQTLDLEARAQDGTPLTGVSWLSTDVSIADVVGS